MHKNGISERRKVVHNTQIVWGFAEIDGESPQNTLLKIQQFREFIRGNYEN